MTKANPEHAPALRAFARLLAKIPAEHAHLIERFANATRPATGALALARLADCVEERSFRGGDEKHVKLAASRVAKAVVDRRVAEMRASSIRARVEWLFGKVLKEEVDLSAAVYATAEELHAVHAMRLGFRPPDARLVIEILERCANRRDAGAEPFAEYETFAAFWREAFEVCGGEPGDSALP